jgi:hypothetical protein
MSKSKRNNKKFSGDRHVRLHHWLTQCPAWGALSPAARCVYLEIARTYNGSNNGRLALSTRDAARRCNIAKDTATKAFRELQAKGFIVLKTRGGFSRKDPHAAEWVMTEHRDDVSGELASKDFMRWRPEETEPTCAEVGANEKSFAVRR